MKLREIAERINAHLKRLEADKDWNRAPYTAGRGYSEDLVRLYGARAWASGPWLYVQYVSYQGYAHLRRGEALRYLEWLDAGNKGWHFKAFREAKA